MGPVNSVWDPLVTQKRASLKNKNKEQDLCIVFRCCSLGSSLKILPCGFFLIDGSVFFKLSNHR